MLYNAYGCFLAGFLAITGRKSHLATTGDYRQDICSFGMETGKVKKRSNTALKNGIF